ncbi:ciliary microtubule associated protein 1A-like [Cyrtonyx montezumae]|uniref:ciliary microtubule associated protein 1A-like n=1 Tax=Cyrtonyx montezumae TaxID=9017 RepID=UPI0032DB1F97
MDGAWVGTWRPHRPRGLISAQFPSPGPQYCIPGTTGYVGHSPTKAHAPMYSFIGFKLPAVESCGPGPCYFVEPAITRKGKYMAPGTHLQGRPRTKTAITPGPSEYHLCSTFAVTLIKPQAPACTFGIQHSIYTAPLIAE